MIHLLPPTDLLLGKITIWESVNTKFGRAVHQPQFGQCQNEGIVTVLHENVAMTQPKVGLTAVVLVWKAARREGGRS